MCGECKYHGCEVLGFILIQVGKRLEWWSCLKHYDYLIEVAWRKARPWERVTGHYPSAVAVESLQAWRTWMRLTSHAYDELRQIGA